jgi:A118 family predicted phage portal protein
MNVAAFIEYLNKTKRLQIDASYYAKIEKWRQWWQGYVPSVHNIKITREDGEHKRRRASLRMPKRVCEDWANLLLNDKTTFQIGDAATAAYLLGSDEQQTGGLLRQLHFWENANKLVEKAYWSGTGAFVLSVEGIKGTDGQLEADPDARIVLDYDPASCILPISVERGVVTEAAFVSECLIDGRPCAYLQTHTVRDGGYTITNEWFEIGQGQDGAPVFTPRKAPVGTVTELQPEGSPPWFSLFSPAAEKNIDGGTGLGMAVFAEALDAAQGVDLAFDNYRQDLYLGGKKIFYDRSLCRKWVDKKGTEHAVPPDAVHRQVFYELPTPEGGIDQPAAWREYNPDLRTASNHQAVQDALDMMSFKCKLGCHRYKFDQGTVTTATEYTGSRQDLVQNANKNQIPIETALIGILRAMLWAAKNLLGAPVDPETSISVNWDDSYIVSEAERTSQLREDAIAGLVPRCRYLSARYSLSEEEAHQWTAEAKADSQSEEQITFGGA